MDIPRPELARRKRRQRILTASLLLLILAAVTFALSRLKPAAPSVEGGSITRGTRSKQGEAAPRGVRGNGTLVPEDIRWITTINAGRIDNVLVLLPARR